MVFPSSVSSRGAMANRDTAGGVPLGLTAKIFGSPPAPFFFCSASAWEPARRAGDMPNSDNIFRLLTFMDELPPMLRRFFSHYRIRITADQRQRSSCRKLRSDIVCHRLH